MIDCYCLICQKSLRTSQGLNGYFYVNDVICKVCRNKLKIVKKVVKINDIKIESFYPYQDEARSLIIQYKEKYDEALFCVFIYPLIKYIKEKYKDYTLVPLPSSKENIEKRGFKHVEKMYSLLNMDMIEVFEKTSNVDQKMISYSKRKDIKEIIVLKQSVRLYDKKILLIDDVITTGQTMKSCYKLLEGNCKELKCMSISYNTRYLSGLQRALIALNKW